MSSTQVPRPAALLLVVALNLLWLTSPPPIHFVDSCGPYYPLTNHLGFMVHCDAIKFVEMARAPRQLLDPEEIQKSRPLFVLMAAGLGYPIDRLVEAVRPGAKPNFPYYLAYLLINLAALVTAVMLFARTLASVGGTPGVTLLLAVPLLCNDVTKSFFWTAQSQMFNVLAPVLAIAAGHYIATRPRLATGTFLAMAFGLGVFLLIYGTFLVLLPVFLLSYWYSQREGRLDWRRLLPKSAMGAALYMLPTLVWIRITIAYAGRYFNREMIQYRQFVWIVDTLRVGPGNFLATWQKHSISFAEALWQPDVVFVTLLTVVVYVATRRSWQSRSGPDRSKQDALAFVCLTTLVCVVVFFWMLGYYPERLAFTVVPPLLAYIGVRLSCVLLTATWAQTLRIATPVMAGIWVIHHVAKYGPFPAA